jgi:hypothetical protein
MQDPNIGRVVNVTNITDKDFTHKYDGAPFTIRSGETLTFPWGIGVHLAKHLARKILLSSDKGATQYDPKDPTAMNGHGSVIWNADSEKAMMARILGESWTVAQGEKKSEIELLRDEIAKMNEWRKTVEQGVKTHSGVATDKTRQELIQELKAAGGSFTPSDTNAVILEKIAALKK